jgi:phosphoribosylaminoimidazole (AIR) synthetase
MLLKKMTYAGTGVDIDKKETAIKELLSSITTKRKGSIGKPMGGHYAGLIEFGDRKSVV